MKAFGLATEISDQATYDRTLERFRDANITLPTFAQLAHPETIPAEIIEALKEVDADAAHPLNLFRVHWYNDDARVGIQEVPKHVVLPSSLTGVDAKIVVAVGDRFPMINAHKVLAAYACLVPRLVSGEFDPTNDRAIWPSTGNYCRGGVAISRIMECRGVAVLPEGMSQERFDWLRSWVVVPDEDVIPTPGVESNVKEIYDKCHELNEEEENVILNQFSEFGNHLVHYKVTGAALEKVFTHLRDEAKAAGHELTLRAFTSATGSAGSIAAGDYLKEQFGTQIVGLEALECPTMLYNGFGEHNIQGIGDKHIPLIHNVMNMDFATAIPDQSTDHLYTLFTTDVGRAYLRDRRGVPQETIDALVHFGLSSIGNILGAIKTAKYLNLGADDVIMTVATDGAMMYDTEREKVLGRDFPKGFDTIDAAEVYGRHMLGTLTDHFEELDLRDKERILNLGYFTWVEQQGIEIPDFKRRRDPAFWREIRETINTWDELIVEFNAKTHG